MEYYFCPGIFAHLEELILRLRCHALYDLREFAVEPESSSTYFFAISARMLSTSNEKIIVSITLILKK